MLYIKFFETSSRVLLIEFLSKKDYSISLFIVFLVVLIFGYVYNFGFLVYYKSKKSILSRKVDFWAGVDAIVIPSRGSVTVNADAIKTSAGALHVLSVCKEKSITEAIRFLQASGVKVYAASEKAFENYTAIKYDGPVAIVMGAEDTGVSMDNLRICDSMVKIPQFGTIGSLNVSVASSILIYEVVRQRMNEQAQ